MPLQFTFAYTLPVSWRQPHPLISGEDTKLYAREEYVLGWEDEQCVMAFAIRYELHVGPFKQAWLIDSVLGVGHEDHFYLYDTIAGVTRLRLLMKGYFGHLYVFDGLFFVADSQGLYCIALSGEQLWKNNRLGIDGVIINRFEGASIWGEGEWDPPSGWRSFILDSRTGDFCP